MDFSSHSLLSCTAAVALVLSACQSDGRRGWRGARPAPAVTEARSLLPPGSLPLLPLPALSPIEPALPVASTIRGHGGSGERFSVSGVDASDTLKVRVAPDPRSAVVGELAPNATGVLATSKKQQRGRALWREVTHGWLEGWVNDRYLTPERGASALARGSRRDEIAATSPRLDGGGLNRQ